MKRTLAMLLFLVALTGCAHIPVRAQVTNVSPQSVVSKNFFNAVTAPTTSGCFSNVGQTVHIVNYTVGGSSSPSGIQLRVEGSFNSDAATCTTGTWFAISDDATDISQSQVVGIGAYPYVRANLLHCDACSGGAGPSLTASYSGTSAIPGISYGLYNPAQQVRKVVYQGQNASNNDNSVGIALSVPYASTAGYILVFPNGATFTGAASLSILTDGNGPSLTLSGGSNAAFLLPPTPTSSVLVRYTHGTTSGGTFTVYYIFIPPGSGPATAQPPTQKNSEVTATNANADVNVTPSFPASFYLYSISARCSAGTAQLLVTDVTASNTQVWSSGATEVGTTTFKFQWNPGLLASLSPHDSVQVRLTPCGGANTGTLDVQASVF